VILTWEDERFGEKPVSLSLCPPQIPQTQPPNVTAIRFRVKQIKQNTVTKYATD